MNKLSELQLLILLQCLKSEQFSRTRLSGLFRKYSLIQKELAIQELLKLELIKKVIKVDLSEHSKTKKHPIFYSLTDTGLAWMTEYAESSDIRIPTSSTEDKKL